MSARIETLGWQRARRRPVGKMLVALLVLLVAVFGVVAIVSLTTNEPAGRVPAVTTSVGSEAGTTVAGTVPGPALKAVANDPYAGADWVTAILNGSTDTPKFGPIYHMGRTCPKCW